MRPAEEGEGLGLKFPLKGGKELNSAGHVYRQKKSNQEKERNREKQFTRTFPLLKHFKMGGPSFNCREALVLSCYRDKCSLRLGCFLVRVFGSDERRAAR